MFCGTVKESAFSKNGKVEDPSDLFKLTDIKEVLKEAGNQSIPADIPWKMPDYTEFDKMDEGFRDVPDKIGEDAKKYDMIVPKRTDIDFSNGGFLSTKIDSRNVDSTGKSTDRTYTNKLKYNHQYILSSMGVQQTYRNSIWKIKTFSNRLGLPVHVQERAAEVFRKMYNSKANIHNSNNMVCACVYFACKEHKINRKMSDIALAAMQELDGTKPLRKSIFLCYQSIIFGLGMSIPKHPTYEQEIVYVGNRIGLPEATIRYAINMLNDVRSKEKLFFAGKSAKLTAAVLLYISALIHNDFMREDIEKDIEIEQFCKVVGGGISQYILKKRAEEYLSDPLFAVYNEKKQERQIII